MTRYLLDTNVIGELQKQRPAPALLDWMGQQIDADLYISAWSLGKTQRGILRKPSGRKRRELEAWFSGPAGPGALFSGRVLSFDGKAALQWAEIMEAGDAIGRPRSPLDMILAATARVHDCVVATANERHFQGVVPMINPLREPVEL